MSSPNWTEFYFTLQQVGPDLLDGVPPGLKRWIDDQSNDSDAFFSDSLYAILVDAWAQEPRVAVEKCLLEWVENVKQHLREILGPYSMFPWEMLGGTQQEKQELEDSIDGITLRVDSEVIDELVEAARADDGQEVPDVS